MDVIEELKSFWENSQKKISGGRGRFGGVRVDANEELKFLCKFKKKKIVFFLGGGGSRGGEGGGVVGLGGGVRVDVNEELK